MREMEIKRELVWTPFYSLVLREVRRFLKVAVQTVWMPMINSSLYLLIFGVSLGRQLVLPGGGSYLEFLIPGLMMMGALSNALMNSSSSIVIAKFSGELEDLRVAPLSEQNIVWALGIGALVRGGIVGLITFLVGMAFNFFTNGALLSVAHPFVLLFFMTVGVLSFGKLGIAVALWSRNFDHVAAINSLVITPLLYLGGVFYSTQSLSPFWRTISHFNPLLYMINGVRFGMSGHADVNIAVASLVVLISLFICHVLALMSLRWGSYNRW